jgi:hypothetical protein
MQYNKAIIVKFVIKYFSTETNKFYNNSMNVYVHSINVKHNIIYVYVQLIG